jgi:hypothetical protein
MLHLCEKKVNRDWPKLAWQAWQAWQAFIMANNSHTSHDSESLAE